MLTFLTGCYTERIENSECRNRKLYSNCFIRNCRVYTPVRGRLSIKSCVLMECEIMGRADRAVVDTCTMFKCSFAQAVILDCTYNSCKFLGCYNERGMRSTGCRCPCTFMWPRTTLHGKVVTVNSKNHCKFNGDYTMFKWVDRLSATQCQL